MTTSNLPAPPAPSAATAEEAAAYVLGRALGLPAEGEGEALAVLRQRVEALRDPTSPGALDELRRHLPVLESLWQRFSVEAMSAKRADDKSKLLRAALQAQQPSAHHQRLDHHSVPPPLGGSEGCPPSEEPTEWSRIQG